MTESSPPAHWKLCTLKDLGTWRGGGTPSKAKSEYWIGGTIPWISPKDMKSLRLTTAQDLITEDAVKNSSANVLPAHSVAIVTRSGILERTLPVAVLEVSAAVNQDLKVLTPISGVDSSFVAYFLRGHERDVLNSCMKNGTTVASVDFTRLLAFEIPIPPLDEQRQIVAEIETQFARLDDAVASLKRARVRLKRYRASVLKAACEGRLVPTEAELARQEGRDYEPASVLLERIRAEREAAPASGRGKRGPTHRRPGSGPGQLSLTVDGGTAPTEGEAELPEGWAWTTLPEIGEVARGKSKHRPRNDPRLLNGPYPFVQTAEVRQSSGRITHHEKTYSEFGLDQSRLWPTGTLCITIAANIAESGILTFDACFPDSVVGFIIEPKAGYGAFYDTFMRTAKDDLERLAPATAQKNINLDTLFRLVVPLPPYAEQERIVTEVDRVTSVIDQMEATVEANLRRAESLRQSILRRAFSGRLLQTGVV